MRQRGGFSAPSSRPADLLSCPSLMVLCCLSSLAAVTVRTQRKKRSWKKMMTRKKTCGVGEHPLAAGFLFPSPFLAPARAPSSWPSHVLSPFLFHVRASDLSFCAAVETETAEAWGGEDLTLLCYSAQSAWQKSSLDRRPQHTQ